MNARPAGRGTLRPVLTEVYVFENGMVAAFDQYGKQMAEYQGRRDEVLPRIKAADYRGVIKGEHDGGVKWPR